MVKAFYAAGPRLFLGAVMLSVLSGCGVWIGGKYYGPPSDLASSDLPSPDLAAAQPVVVTPPPPPRPRTIPKPQKPHKPQAQVDLAESQELDQLYQKLTLLLPLDGQWELAQEQYAWRNKRAILCDRAGVFDTQCGDEITAERIADLSGRVDTLSRSRSSVPAGAAPAPLPPSISEALRAPVPEVAAPAPLPPSVSEALRAPVPEVAAPPPLPPSVSEALRASGPEVAVSPPSRRSVPEIAAPPPLRPSGSEVAASPPSPPSVPEVAAPPPLRPSGSEVAASLPSRPSGSEVAASPPLPPSVPEVAAPPPLRPTGSEVAASPPMRPSVPEVTASPPLRPSVPAVAASPHVAAHKGTYTVAATAMPWVWKPGGLNSSFQYGLMDGSPPTVIALAELNARAGQYLTIRYVRGQIALGAGGPKADGRGYVGQKDHGGNGITGRPLPSTFMGPYPINLGSLVGVFTDKNGGIVGSPFAIGAGAVRKQVPPGAQQIQLGVNDDIFGAANAETGNSGSFTVAVSPGHS
jgi:hypothetical protein